MKFNNLSILAAIFVCRTITNEANKLMFLQHQADNSVLSGLFFTLGKMLLQKPYINEGFHCCIFLFYFRCTQISMKIIYKKHASACIRAYIKMYKNSKQYVKNCIIIISEKHFVWHYPFRNANKTAESGRMLSLCFA